MDSVRAVTYNPASDYPSSLPEPGEVVAVTDNAIPWWVYALGAVAIGYFVLPKLLKR